jgi:long-chain fatty acid transport protein
MKNSPRVVVPLLTAATLLVPGTSFAGGFSVDRFAGERGHAASDHVSSIYFNPAGIALAGGTNIYVEGTGAYRVADFNRDPGAVDNVLTDPNAGTGTPQADIDVNSGPAKLRNALVSPFFAASSDFGLKGFAFGLGFYVPFGGQATWGTNKNYDPETNPGLAEHYPGGFDGTQRWAAIEGEQKSVYLTAALAYATPSKKLAFGASISDVNSNVYLIRARNLSGTDDVVTNGVATEGRSLLDVKGHSIAASVGVMALVTPCLRAGLSYLSQPGFGDMKLQGDLTNKFGPSETFAVPVELRQALPDQVKFAVEWNAFLKGALRFGVDYTRWSTYSEQCIIQTQNGESGICAFNEDGSKTADAGEVLLNLPRKWNDSVGMRVGGSWWPADALELTAGLIFDTNAVPDETIDPALMDSNKIVSTLGAVYELNRHLSIQGTLGNSYYFNRDVAVRPADEDLKFPSRNPDQAGSYKQNITYMSIGLGLHL